MENKNEKIPFQPRFRTRTNWGDTREIYEPDLEGSPELGPGIELFDEPEWEKEPLSGDDFWAEEPRKASRRVQTDHEESAPLEDPEPKKGRKRGLSFLMTLLLVCGALIGSAEAAQALDLDVLSWIPFAGAEQAESAETGTEEDQLEPEEGAAPPEERQNLGEQIAVLDYDINYSQSDRSFSEDGVDVLLRVRNDNDQPICSTRFTVLTGDGPLVNAASGEEEFTAEGYVEPGGEGFLYAKLFLDDGTPHRQGELVITDAGTCQALEGYQRPDGRVCGFHRDTDTYDVEVQNHEQSPVDHRQVTVIAVQKQYQRLESSWGAGPLPRDLAAGEKTVLRNVLYNPGFKHYDQHEYEVFLIDRSKYTDLKEPVL